MSLTFNNSSWYNSLTYINNKFFHYEYSLATITNIVGIFWYNNKIIESAREVGLLRVS